MLLQLCGYTHCQCCYLQLTVALHVKFRMHPTRDRVWDMASGTQTRKLEGHDRAVSSVAISSDNKNVVSGSWDKTVRCVLACQRCSFRPAPHLTVLSSEPETMVLLSGLIATLLTT
jgi:hypothetical protein